LQRVVRGAQRMDRLLEDVLMLSRAQRTVHPTDEVDAGEVVADVLRQLEPRIRETAARVHVADDLPHLKVDRPWVTQALYNLIVNALKFTRPGEAPDVEVAAYHNGQDTRAIVVRDRGPGVAPEHAERIFELFQRAVGREVEGTGAGLAIVRQVAERHGGRAWVQPRPAGGSEFVITFGPVNDT
jgi:signal transduction histidine kinase